MTIWTQGLSFKATSREVWKNSARLFGEEGTQKSKCQVSSENDLLPGLCRETEAKLKRQKKNRVKWFLLRNTGL